MLASSGDAGLDIDAVLGIVSRPDDDDLTDLVGLVATLCDAPAAGLTIRKDDAYHVPVTYGITPLVCPSTDTFCQFTMATDDVVVVEDARSDPRLATLSWVDGTIASARFYASAPVHAPDGTMVGRLCVIDDAVRTLNDVQRRSLLALAASITHLIDLRLLRRGRPAPIAAVPPETHQAAATVVSQLAAELSHDLRVPLSSMTAGVELLREELEHHESPLVAALLVRTARAAERMERMLDQTMDYGAAGEVPERTLVDLGVVAQQLVLNSAPLLDAQGAVVEAHDLPVVHADPDDMYSVLQNLLTNAVKFARPGVPARVRLSARRRAGSWRISVRDNGVGIPEEHRVDVFSLFSRVDSAVEGHGIGLATVSRIVSAHGGRAGAAPAPDGGTEMWFELPDDLTPEALGHPVPVGLHH